jgi:hypothetical protein
MPRLTNPDYLEQLRFLCTVYRDCNVIYDALSLRQYRAVMHFFNPDLELMDEEAISRRVSATHDDRSLPARAGKGFAQLYVIFREAYVAHLEQNSNPAVFFRVLEQHARRERVPEPVMVGGKPRDIRVVGYRRKDPDLQQMSRALITQALFELEQQHEHQPDA